MINEVVKTMVRAQSWKNGAIAAATLFGLLACGGEDAEQATTIESLATAKMAAPSRDVGAGPGDDKYVGPVSKPGSPYTIAYRIIGTPVVGSPVTVALRVAPNLGSQPVNLEYRINDATSMVLADSQPARVRMEFVANEPELQPQVTVVPQREGRFYLNVSASFETDDGTLSTITAIPIQVGAGSRELQPNGEVQVDENGETVRVLTGE